MFNVFIVFLRRNTKLSGGQVCDTGVGLVEHKAVHIRNGAATLLQNLLHAPGYRFHCKAEHSPAIHGNEGGLLQAGTRDTKQLIVPRTTQLGANGGPPARHSTTAAPAPSPKRTQVDRSVKSVNRLSTSQPTTSPRDGQRHSKGTPWCAGQRENRCKRRSGQSRECLPAAPGPAAQASCGRDQRLRRHCGHNAGSHLLRPDSGSLQGPLGRLTAQLGVGLAWQ